MTQPEEPRPMTEEEIVALVRERCYCHQNPLSKPCNLCAANMARLRATLDALRRERDEATARAAKFWGILFNTQARLDMYERKVRALAGVELEKVTEDRAFLVGVIVGCRNLITEAEACALLVPPEDPLARALSAESERDALRREVEERDGLLREIHARLGKTVCTGPECFKCKIENALSPKGGGE